MAHGTGVAGIHEGRHLARKALLAAYIPPKVSLECFCQPRCRFITRDVNFGVIERALRALTSIATSPEGAQTTVDANVLEPLPELLESPNTGVREWTCELLARLAWQQSTRAAVLHEKPCLQLVSLLRDDNLTVLESAAKALNFIVEAPEGARAAVDAKVLDCVGGLLEYSGVHVRCWTYNILEKLVPHTPTAVLTQLVSLVRNGNPAVMERAAKALHRIIASPTGEQAAMDATVFGCMLELLGSQNIRVRKWTCEWIAELVCQEAAKDTILGLQPCVPLVFLLRDENTDVIQAAVQALYWIAATPHGALAVVEANVLDSVAGLFESSSTLVLNWTCDMLDKLASQELTATAVMRELISLLRGGNLTVIEQAAKMLFRTAESPDRVRAAVAADILDFVSEFLGSPSAAVRRWIRATLGQLAYQKTTAKTVLRQLVPLLRGIESEPNVIASAAQVLYRIAGSAEGAQAIVDANVLPCVAELLRSPSIMIRKWICATVGQLAYHESTVMAVLNANLCLPLVLLLRDEPLKEKAAYALSEIARLPDGAQAVMDAKIQDVTKLLTSQNTSDREEACFILTQLASQEPSMPDVVRVNLCRMLVSRLRDGNLDVVEQAAHGVCYIIAKAKSFGGAQAAVDANVLAYVPELLQSPSPWVMSWTCAILHELSSQENTATAVLDVNPCGLLVELCRHRSLDLRASALFALEKISESPTGAAIIARTDILEHVSYLMQSPDPEVRLRTNILVKNLAKIILV
ncbi:armadillo-type protein [Mycena latifolia]|nr:armadillo-type protein [Mycena latifolia]